MIESAWWNNKGITDNGIHNTLLNLRNDLKIEMEDQETSRSVRNYKKELMDAVVMVIKHYKQSL